ncbi:MAG: hypothetical protein O9267_04560 [Flavobacterium sp.]|uniref:hypothetical protein n=1 Tax=Flavobacterium sp. TaxID=239 RepID=UPI0022C2D736|nr:hypothetical protein [Flavobacterium sp.]MCZ8196858.1 hypothetical protein [Flavobacterium sp.]
MSNKVKFSFSSLLSFPTFLLFVMFSCASMNAQTKDVTSPSNISVANGENNNSISKSDASAETNFQFVSWFMGTKQTIKEEGVLDKASAKKMFINARIAPNRILMKAFLKKAQNQLSTLA